MTLVGDPRPAAPLERQPANAFRRSFAVGYDEPEATVSDGDGPVDVAPPRLSRRERRRQRTISRRRFLVIPVVVALLVVSAKLLGMSWWSRQGVDAYDDGRFAASGSEFAHLRSGNIIEPWKAWMGIGAAQFRMADLVTAEAAFSRALELNAGRCDVRFNLAVTIEADGDRRMGNDVNEVTETEQIDGLARYRVALDIANEGSCPLDGPAGPGTRLAETRERLEAKLGGEGNPRNDSATNDPNSEPEENMDQSDSSSQEDQLQQRNQTGAAERQDSSDIDPAGAHEPNEPNW